MFTPFNIPIRYGRPRPKVDSKIDSNEYEWGPEPLSKDSTEEDSE